MRGARATDLLAGLRCPFPIGEYPTVTLAHGGGGRLSQMLIETMFLSAFDNPVLAALGDAAVLRTPGGRLAFSTDSFVVSPLFFPGGDIGSLAVHGTTNDLAMCGARPLGLSVGMILEEGLAMEDLRRVVDSMRRAALAIGVPIVAGDTKVVDRGKGDGLFVNVSGIGLLREGIDVTPNRVRPGDAILVNGAIAVHGVAIMSLREGLEFETTLESDTAPLHDLVRALLDSAGDGVHAMRDPTRGGVASALNEIARQADVGIRIDETRIPLDDQVRGACEILGLDPLYVANEGKCLMFVAGEVAETALETLRAHPAGRRAGIIGEVVAEHAGQVVLENRFGGTRCVDYLSGEQLPRIC